MQVGSKFARPQNQLEDTANHCLEAVASTITKLDKIGIKVYEIEVAEHDFQVYFNKFLVCKDLEYSMLYVS